MIEYDLLFKNVPPELATLLIATLPIAELRASLPIALGIYKLPILSAYFWSVLGNLLPVLFLAYFLEPISQYLIKNSKIGERFFTWLFERTRKKFTHKFLKYGQYALIVFVAIPLPVTGGWTGTIAAFLFGIPRWRAMGFITIGVLIAGVIVTLIYQGAFNLFNI